MSPLSWPPEPARLGNFPSRRVTPETLLFRVHWHDRGPWWFSHDRSGRFDLVPPRGTCYLAEGPLGAFIEVFRAVPDVPRIEVEVRRISVLRLPREMRVADCTSRRARAFGITAAIHSGQDYGLTRAWAEALADAGFEGVRYLASHDPAQRYVGIALFGAAGAADGPIVSTDPIDSSLLTSARRQFGIRVVPDPEF